MLLTYIPMGTHETTTEPSPSSGLFIVVTPTSTGTAMDKLVTKLCEAHRGLVHYNYH